LRHENKDNFKPPQSFQLSNAYVASCMAQGAPIKHFIHLLQSILCELPGHGDLGQTRLHDGTKDAQGFKGGGEKKGLDEFVG
jgi:hypothetical protein